jgi:hypothetical protein
MRASGVRMGRVGGQPYRETLDPETLAPDLDDGALAGGEYALLWHSAVLAKCAY